MPTSNNGDHVKPVSRLIAERPDVDTTPVFKELCTIQDALWDRIRGRFALTPDPSTARFQPYASPDGQAQGTLAAWSGPEIDWAVYGRIGTPGKSFCNLNINVWLGPQTKVPHLMFQFGTYPATLFYMDYFPRVHFLTTPGYMDRYFDQANAQYMELMQDDRLKPFVSQSTYVRALMSPVALCFIAEPGTDGVVDLIRTQAHAYLDRWLGWVDDAEPVRPHEYPELALRDLELRRHAAERDPANVVPERIYGTQVASAVVRALWGGDRHLARPGR
ncbi:MAG: red chlorophyll catabolite reductase [Acidobacteria bacterium]|nr:red chlorophyll catabolite reductase [Acidobacteriota bacterium]